ncbi:hypothetical protein HanXRQr2_Chr14g0620931 [Helianthus annuus]|uniref:Uncharacterized protein n=1 Tax=Helianthus annuus TaxID=4232 RepID=A0A9K3E508_HELAN|nr:hypothetical protein HanXRQr2_Chr14g0620931 [Helianthus annuus]KAJ0838538.1 hypothetical protein HanPSC8_Chr14g0596041 [Helianthus annuus]
MINLYLHAILVHAKDVIQVSIRARIYKVENVVYKEVYLFSKEREGYTKEPTAYWTHVYLTIY